MSDEIPWIGFGGEQLAGRPPLRDGDVIVCPHCKANHEVKDSKPPMLLMYNCAGTTYIAGINGVSVIGVEPATSGTIK